MYVVTAYTGYLSEWSNNFCFRFSLLLLVHDIVTMPTQLII